jgi:diaminopimelate epimerase
MTAFYRLSGGGNDFLVLVEPTPAPEPAVIRAWCARGLSAGADGLITLEREEGAVRMVYFNSDGGRAALCINGTRCAARLARELGWSGESLTVRTDAGPIEARDAGPDRIAVALPPPGRAEPVDLALEDRSFNAWRVDVGVPHLVVPWASGLATAPVAALGPRLRSHPALGAAGANVDFARFPGKHRLELRSFERGVEAETLACGTGVLAAVAVGVALDRLEPPIEVLIAGGFLFQVDGGVEDRLLTSCTLTGDARIIARGELLAGAATVPGPPQWSAQVIPQER